MNLPHALTEERLSDVGRLVIHYVHSSQTHGVRAGAQIVAIVCVYPASGNRPSSSLSNGFRFSDHFEKIRTLLSRAFAALAQFRDRLAGYLHESVDYDAGSEEPLLDSEAMRYLAKFVQFAGCYLQTNADAKSISTRSKQRLVLPRKCIYMMAQVYRRTTGSAPSFFAGAERDYSPFVRFVIAFARTYGWEKIEGENELGLTEAQMVRDIEDAYIANPGYFISEPRRIRSAARYSEARYFGRSNPTFARATSGVLSLQPREPAVRGAFNKTGGAVATVLRSTHAHS